MKDYQLIQEMIEQMKLILKRTDVEHDNHAPIKTAIRYLRYVEIPE